jgi:hypothetical protein
MLFKNLMQYNSGSETFLKKNHLTDVKKRPAINKHTCHSKIGMATPYKASGLARSIRAWLVMKVGTH